MSAFITVVVGLTLFVGGVLTFAVAHFLGRERGKAWGVISQVAGAVAIACVRGTVLQ